MTLREPFAMIVVVGAVLLPGALAVSLWGKRFRDDPLEFLFAGLALGVLIFGWLALLLAELGYFSLAILGALWAVLMLGLGASWWRRRRACGPDTPTPSRAWHVDRWEIAGLGVWALVAAWLFFRPHEFVMGAADAGVYVNLGANIAHTGGILIHDPTLAALDPSLYPALLRPLPPGELTPYYLMPAFYVPGSPAGLIIPQFYPLHPVWQAIAYALGGLRAELLVTPLWGWLGALAVYFTTRRLWGWHAGMLALAALSATALQVWFARYPTTEMLTQYLLWTGAWALIAWLDKREPRGLWAALAGGALGQVFLVRIDTYFLLALPVLVGFWLWRTHDWRQQDAWFFAPFLFLAAHSLIHGVFLSSPYFFSLFNYGRGVISRSLMLPLALVSLAALALIALSLRPRLRVRVVAWVGARRSLWVTGATILVAAVAVYDYFVRPHLGQIKTSAYWYGGGIIPNLDRENFVRLGWYLGPAGIALSVAGICWMLIKELNRRTAFLLSVGLFFSLFYLWRIQANPHQIYAMRRYVPVVLPFFIIAAAYLINWLFTNLRGKARWFVSIGLTLVWFSGILFSARGFVSQVDYRGIIDHLDRFNAKLPPHSVLIFGDAAPVGIGDMLGTPLHFLYGHDVFTLRDLGALDNTFFAETVEAWQRAGRSVYWIGVTSGPAWPAISLTPGLPTDYHFDVTVLEHAYDHKPAALTVEKWQIPLAEVSRNQK
jgi:hypothetical protein